MTTTPQPPANPPIELADPTGPFKSAPDTRPRMPEPLPVKLVTIEHAHLPAAAGKCASSIVTSFTGSGSGIRRRVSAADWNGAVGLSSSIGPSDLIFPPASSCPS